MTSTKIRGRFLPSFVYHRWKWTVRFGLMIVPCLLFLTGAMQLYVTPGKYRSTATFEFENGPSPQEIMGLVHFKAVLYDVVDRLKPHEQFQVDRDTIVRLINRNTECETIPGTSYVKISTTLTKNSTARDVVEQLPLSIQKHLADTATKLADEKVSDINQLIRQAADVADEKSTNLARLQKALGPKPEDQALLSQLERARRASILADAEVERLQSVKSSYHTQAIDNAPRLIMHSMPVIADRPIASDRWFELGSLLITCVASALGVALLLPYLLELAFPPNSETIPPLSATDLVDNL